MQIAYKKTIKLLLIKLIIYYIIKSFIIVFNYY